MRKSTKDFIKWGLVALVCLFLNSVGEAVGGFEVRAITLGGAIYDLSTVGYFYAAFRALGFDLMEVK